MFFVRLFGETVNEKLKLETDRTQDGGKNCVSLRLPSLRRGQQCPTSRGGLSEAITMRRGRALPCLNGVSDHAVGNAML